ncbi:MAG TPA: ATP-binding protein [Candidatus Saccharimonadales bacterium]
MTKFWHRRISEAAMFVSGLLIALYIFPFFMTLGPIGDSLVMPDWGAALAAATFIYSFVLYLWVPPKTLFPSSLSVYLLTVTLAATLTIATGGAFSSFISLWVVITVFAGAFGIWGVAPISVAAASYIGYLIYTSVNLPITQIVIIVATTVAPLIASIIIFHAKSKKSEQEETAYHQLAEELSQVSNKSDVVINAIDDGVIATDSKGNIQLMNPAAQRILGWGDKYALKLNYPSVLKLSDGNNQALTDANDPIAKVLATNHDVHTKEFYATTGGSKRILLSLTVSPIGQLGEGVIIVFRDITKEAAEEREQAEFISTASHEMRTPVASIEGYLGLALNPNTATIDEKARDFITKAHESAQHLGRLFQDLLDVSKADDGRLSNHPKIVDVIDYLVDIVEGLRPKADEKKLRLFYKPQPDANATDDSISNRVVTPVYYANVDNDHLREVVANLVENAIKYTPKGDVVVDVTGTEDHVTISITDSGIGIAKEDIAHLFQKFYRIDNSATREIGGTGLGLYLCRRLAEVMGGRIWVESEPGKGSTFNLELPRTDRMDAMRMLEAESSEITADSIGTSHIDTSTTEQTTDPLLSEEPLAAQSIESSAPPVLNAPSEQAPAPVELAAAPPPTAPPVPIPQPLATPAPSAPAAPAPTLASIEQNPGAYTLRTTPGVQIPVRDQGSEKTSQ